MAQPNQYIKENMKNAIPYVELTQEITSKLGSKIKTSKHLLTLLRELSLYSGPNQGYNDGLAKSLLAAIKDTSTQDVEKKIVRTSYFLLSDMVTNTANVGAMQKVSTDLIHHLQYEVKQASGSRLCMAWRLLARMVYACHMEDLVEGTLKSAIKTLRYPEREKKMIGQKKADIEFENQVHFWTALFSSMRRIRRAPSPDMTQAVLTGCRSPHNQLARHAFYLLKSALETHPYEVGQYFLASLKDGGFLSRASTDTMSCVYLMECCKTFIVATEADEDENVPRQGPIEDTLIVVLKMLEDSRVKVRVECVRILTEIQQGPFFHRALKSIGGGDLISRLTASILTPLQRLVVPLSDEEGLQQSQQQPSLPAAQRKEIIGFGNVSLFPLCRACIRLGRYLVMHSSSQDSQASEEIGERDSHLEELVRPLGKELGKLCRGFVQSSVYLPHARSEVLKALLWIMPNNRGAVPQHNELWRWLSSHVELSLPVIGEDLSEHVINHIFGRVKVSSFYCETLLEMALRCAEDAVKIFVTEGGKSVGVLIQVWQKLQEYGDHPHSRDLLLASLLRVVDASMWSAGGGRERGVDSTPGNIAHASRKELGYQGAQEMSHRQSLQSLRHFAFWALGEYVHLWDFDQVFKSGHPVDSSALSLSSVMFDFSPPRASSPFADTPSSSFAAGAGEEAGAKEVPTLVRVVAALLHSLQMESERMASVCLASLFKIAMWCPHDKESAVRDLIREEMREIAASAFGQTHPLAQSSLEEEEGFELFRCALLADPRSVLTSLERMGLGHTVEVPDRGGTSSYSTCHYGARKWSSGWQSSAVCREALLFSLALESLVVAKHPPRISSLEEINAKVSSSAAAGEKVDDIGGDLFGLARQGSFDLLGDIIIEEPMVSSTPFPADSGAVGGEDLLGGGVDLSATDNFVVDNAELKRHMYLLTRLVRS